MTADQRRGDGPGKQLAEGTGAPVTQRTTDDKATLVKRVLQLAQGMRSVGSRSERSRRVLMGLAFLLFVGMGIVALRNYPDDVPQSPNWLALVAVGLAGPLLSVALNAAEYRVQCRMVGRAPRPGEALQVTVLGTAANLLPLPGSMMVRTQALAGGAGYRAAIRSTTIAGAAWLFCTAALAGIALVAIGLPLLGAAVAAVGAAGIGGSAWLTRRTTDNWRPLFGQLLLVETGTALVGAGRLLGILLALGLDVSVGQAVALTLSGVIAAATGIFPSGLGIREAVAAGIASAVSLPAAVGFVATGADRIAGLLVLAFFSIVVLAKKPPTPSTDPDEEMTDTASTDRPDPSRSGTDPSETTAIAGYYDDYSSWYDDERRFGYYELINDLEVEKIAPRLRGARSLEIGCGTGLLLERTDKLASFAVGIDLSSGMASVSAAKGLAVANASVTDLGFHDDSFDVVYSCKVLPHVPDIRSALQEIRRVLAPNGRMFLEFYNPTSLKNLTYRLRWRGTREEPVFVRFDTADTLRAVLPDGVVIRSVRGIRTFGPTRHFYTLPLLRQVTSWLDRRFCDSWIGSKFGGYLLFELEDTAAA